MTRYPAPYRRPVSGFTLIEVMVVVAIIAILAAIALPSYQEYVRRSQAQEALAILADFRAKMEQYYQDRASYRKADGTCGAAEPKNLQHFKFECKTPFGDQSYLAELTGNEKSPVDGLVYEVNHLNERKTTCNGCAWAFPEPQNYWVTRKGM